LLPRFRPTVKSSSIRAFEAAGRILARERYGVEKSLPISSCFAKQLPPLDDVLLEGVLFIDSDPASIEGKQRNRPPTSAKRATGG
jgi:hypothetical protein